MKQKTFWAALLLAAAMVLALGACGSGGGEVPASPSPSASESPAPSPTPSTDPATRGLITVNVGGEPRTLDPTGTAAAADAMVISHVFEGLMKFEPSDAEADDHVDLAQVTYGQAETYDRAENADGTVTYTFHLRKDAKWSDGKPVTAQDFVYAWQRLADPANGATYRYLLDDVVNAKEIAAGSKEPTELAARAVDDATFAVTLRADVPYFPQICALPPTFPVRQDVVEKDMQQWTYAPETYIGNGMYKLTAWEHGAQIVLEPNDKYYDADAQAAERVTFVLVEDAVTIRSAFEGGTLDFARGAAGEETPKLLDEGKLFALDYVGTYFVSFQTQKEPFNDARVREAFTLAVDREKLVDEVAKGGQAPAAGLVPSGISDAGGVTEDDFRAQGGDYFDPDAYADNRKEAKTLLAEAGYPDGAGFPEVTYLYNTGETHKAVAEALQTMWQDTLGVKVTLQEAEWGEFLQARKAGEFSIARGSWLADYDDPMSFLDLWRTGASGNDAHYADEGYDKLMTDAHAADDPARRMERLHQAEDLLIGRDYAVCPLYFYSQTYMTRDNLDGVYYSPLGYYFFNACSKK